jgi:microcystin-dependent protein
VAVNPRTVNLGIIVPLTGADVDTWGEDDVNPNMVSFDGFIGGVQTIALAGSPVTLTSPAGFTATPSAGPTQAENRVLRFTGTLSADVLVTLPLPGVYVVENLTVQGASNFVVQLRGGVAATEVIGLPFGSTVSILNDGSNVRFLDMGKVADMEFWVGVSALPRWVTACTKMPYLACDGSTLSYNFSDYPQLGPKMGSTFGGNGITTFGVPDMAGRVPLAYDRTGTRITVAGCGINGQTLGAVLDKQTNTLLTANLPPYTPSGTLTNITSNQTGIPSGQSLSSAPTTGGSRNVSDWGSGTATIGNITSSGTFVGAAQGGNSIPVNNVQPTQVSGIWAIKT